MLLSLEITHNKSLIKALALKGKLTIMRKTLLVWKENKDVLYFIGFLASAPLWFRDNGNERIDGEIWFWLYTVIFIAGFPLAFGHILLRLYRKLKYSSQELEVVEPIKFLQIFTVGWLSLICVGIIVYYFFYS